MQQRKSIKRTIYQFSNKGTAQIIYPEDKQKVNRGQSHGISQLHHQHPIHRI